jgi:hypothetical protein
MEQRINLRRLCLILTAARSLLGVGVRTICMLCCFEADIGYFTPGILPAISNLLYFAAALAPVLCMAFTPKEQMPKTLHADGRAIPAVLLGLVLAGFTLISLLICFPARKSDTMIASSMLGLLAATYYFFSIGKDDCFTDWRALLGTLSVFWCIAAVADTYFDTYTTMNSPIKISLQMGFLGFMLMMLGELRFRLNRPMPRYSTIFLSVGSYACLVGSIPLLIAVCAGAYSHLRHTMYAVVLLFAGSYSLFHLFRYTQSSVPASDSFEETPAEPCQNQE